MVPAHLQTESLAYAALRPISFGAILAAVAIHAPMMQLFLAVPFLATIHSLAVLLAGVYFLGRDEQPIRVTWVIAYIAGAELLWRGAEAAVVWEYGKYATLLLCTLVILKYHLFKRAGPWPWLFLVLLLPGLFVSGQFNRSDISFQLAGPVALAVAVIAIGPMTFNAAQLQRVFLALIAPAAAIGFLEILSFGTNEVVFNAGSNELVTGGIGANQVVSTLSLGATAAYLYANLLTKEGRIRRLMLGLFIVLLGLSVLTFSRAGLWNTLGAIVPGVLVLVSDRKWAPRAIGVLLGVGLFIYLVVFPAIVDLTGGLVLNRFSDFDSTGRLELAEIDLEVFMDHPVYGVGVGGSLDLHIPYFGYRKNTHTEYSRLLAEHGLLGVAVILLLAGALFTRTFNRRPPAAKCLSISLTLWALLYMVHAATRMVAPSFAFGLAAAHLLPEADVPTG